MLSGRFSHRALLMAHYRPYGLHMRVSEAVRYPQL